MRAMTAYAVIKTGGKQYRVSPDDVIVVEKLASDVASTVTFDDVLMVGDGDTIAVGAPRVDGASVTGEIVDQRKGEKLLVFKKKRRQNYRRTKGHRQLETIVRITAIAGGGVSAKATAAAKPKAAKADTAPKADAKPAAKPASDDALPVLFLDAPDGDADDLKKISGVGPVLEKKLNALGIYHFRQIAAFTADDIARVDEVLNFKGRIERDEWLSQAATLAEGEE